MENTAPIIINSPVGAEIVLDGRPYVNFGGSSYLGLSCKREILEAGAAELRLTGAGYQISRQHGVTTRAYQEVETEAAVFFHSPAALYMAAGYHFGLVAVSAIKSQFTTIFFDEVAHYSLRDAIAASGLSAHSFRHLDAEDLAVKLSRNLRGGDRPLIATDGMYSTLGEIAPLAELAGVVAQYEGRLLVDESHSFGVLGANGRGAHEHHQIPHSAALIGGSLTKGFGTSGGIIAAGEAEIAACRAAPAILGASAGLPAAAAMGAQSLRYVRTHPELLTRLRANIAYLKSGLRDLGLNVGDSVAPVAAFSVGSEQTMQTLHAQLMAEGIYVLHSKYIGAGGAGVIRCGIFADHTIEHLKHLLDALRRLL